MFLQATNPKKKLIPADYAEKDLVQYMKFWMKIGQVESIKISKMDKLKAMLHHFRFQKHWHAVHQGIF